MRRVTPEERRNRLGARHRLSEPAADPAEVARSLTGVHSTDPASMVLAMRRRLERPDVEAIEHALYGERTVVRILGMRRTVWVVPTELRPVVQAACTEALLPGERRKAVDMLEAAAVTPDGENWLRETGEAALSALRARGEATAAELSEDVPAMRERILVAEGTKYEALQGMGPRVLFLLAAEGRIVRGRPLGSWTSTLYKWAPTEDWLGGEPDEMPVEEARVTLVGSWLRSFGPGTFTDLKWWTGWPAGRLKKVLAALDVEEVELETGTGFVLADDAEPVESPGPWAALLPALDPTVMGWSERGWYLGEHKASLFDRNGNAGPTVWWGGRIVGGWAQRSDGEIALRLLEDPGTGARAAIDQEAGSLEEWLGAVRFIPRFRTPLERELTA
ncbi:MAG: winged helix DNA-binding domain-containing protein [Solirubrobacterales bacterium]|nr:winged helix DNA-binding domain-containing protein [Solirubrobacterales bacterium]